MECHKGLEHFRTLWAHRIWMDLESTSVPRSNSSEGPHWQVSLIKNGCIQGFHFSFISGFSMVDVDMSYSDPDYQPICYVFSFHLDVFEELPSPCRIKWLGSGPQPAYLQSNAPPTKMFISWWRLSDYPTELFELVVLYPAASFHNLKDMQDTFYQTHLTCPVLQNPYLEPSVVNVSYFPNFGHKRQPRGEACFFPVQPREKDLAPL